MACAVTKKPFPLERRRFFLSSDDFLFSRGENDFRISIRLPKRSRVHRCFLDRLIENGLFKDTVSMLTKLEPPFSSHGDV